MTDQQLMESIKNQHGATIDAACRGSSVPSEFVAALIANESGGDPAAVRFEPGVFQSLVDVLTGKRAMYQTHGMKKPLGSADLMAWIEPQNIRPALRVELTMLRELATSKGLTQIMGWHSLEFNRGVPLTGSPTDQLSFTLQLLTWFAEAYTLDVKTDFSEMFHCWNTGTPVDPPATYSPTYIPDGLRRMELYKTLP